MVPRPNPRMTQNFYFTASRKSMLEEIEQDRFSPMLSVYKRGRPTVTTKKVDEENNHEERRGDLFLSLDLIVEILKRLPAKSLVRFRSVSKQWSAIIGSRRDFIESIVTRSLRHPPQKLPLFIFHHTVPETFFTVSPVFSHCRKDAVTIPGSSLPCSFDYQYARGLICCSSGDSHLVTIYNPTTRQLFPLPKIEAPVARSVRSHCYFGYDPVMNQYKVLSIVVQFHCKKTFHVFTLGCQTQSQSQSWRKIKGIDEKFYPSGIYPSENSVCIDGTIYYGATYVGIPELESRCRTVILSFDIRSERFDHVCAPEALWEAFSTSASRDRALVNHLGKLGCICCHDKVSSIWIMDDAEKQEWSTSVLCFPRFEKLLESNVSGFSGVTPAGEIFATQDYFFYTSLYVYYYNMNQNSFRRVQIEGGVPDNTKQPIYRIRVFAIYDHVENTMWL